MNALAKSCTATETDSITANLRASLETLLNNDSFTYVTTVKFKVNLIDPLFHFCLSDGHTRRYSSEVTPSAALPDYVTWLALRLTCTTSTPNRNSKLCGKLCRSHWFQCEVRTGRQKSHPGLESSNQFKKKKKIIRFASTQNTTLNNN